ncbi:MAG: peptide deformylase [Armatimonadota bacterium]
MVKYPAEVLRQKAVAVERVNKELRQFAEEMVRAMRSANGIGLAAPQLGRAVRLTISAAGGKPRAFFNPEIVASEGEQVGLEGCLSLPGLYGDVKRAAKVRVRFVDEDNRVREETFEDLEARVMQHEIDHLDGVLFIDRVAVETLHWEWPLGARDSA